MSCLSVRQSEGTGQKRHATLPGIPLSELVWLAVLVRPRPGTIKIKVVPPYNERMKLRQVLLRSMRFSKTIVLSSVVPDLGVHSRRFALPCAGGVE